MIIVLIILGFIVLSIIIKIAQASKKEIDLSKEVEKLGALEGLLAIHVEGLGIGQMECKIIRFDDRILIDANTYKFEIRLNQIRAALVKSEQELIEKSKSVVGRALIGTLLVPGLGTIVGGMSGIGTKKKEGKTNHYMIINYIDAKDELAAITLQDTVKFIMNKFCKNVNKSIPQSADVIQL